MAYEYRMQLTDAALGKAITDVVTFQVVANGTPNRVSITDLSDVALANPATGQGGAIEFRTAESVASVDIFGFTSNGDAFQLRGVTPGGVSEVRIDKGRLDQVLIIPFDIVDTEVVAAAETDSGFDYPQYFSTSPYGLGVFVETADSGITLDVGTNSTTGTDDADGLMDGVSMTTAGMVFGTVGFAVGTNSVLIDLTGGDVEYTYGVLVLGAATKGAKGEGTDSATTKNGMYILVPHVATGGTASLTERITFTLSSGADTAAGYIIIPGRKHLPL